MDPIYVIGHRNPDTDSIVSAIAYAALQNAMGNSEYHAGRLGHLNDETAFLLNKFGFTSPIMIRSVKTQVGDLEFDHPPVLSWNAPVRHAWELLRANESLSSLPVADENGKLWGLITAGSIAESDMRSITDPYVQDLPVYNLLNALEGQIINHEEDVFDSISGRVLLAMPSAIAQSPIDKDTIVICGQQEDIIKEALHREAACIIICQSDLTVKFAGTSSQTCIIVTPCDAYRAARMLYQSIPVSRIAVNANIVHFHLNDYLDDVRDTVLESRFRSYPIEDEQGTVVGTLSRYHLIRPKRKRVVLVDHNERSQSVDGLEEAEIIAILDHHRLADVQTGSPVFMRNEPVGSTTTIIATMYQEKGLMPSPKLAGLMAAAILSDTVVFKSPTCTAHDRRIADRLARIAGIDLEQLGREIFSIGTSPSKSVDDLLNADFKEFHIGGHSLGVSQITTLDTDMVLSRRTELLDAMQHKKEANHYDMVMLMLTDVLREGTELLFIGDQEIVRNAFDAKDMDEHQVFLPRVVSRKKQIIPALAILWG